MFHTIVSIKNDGHYFCRAGGNRPDGLNEPVTIRVVILLLQKRRNRGKLVFPGLPGLDNDASGGGVRINCYCLP
ncbi:hypothetical protein F6743_24105 [Salmonella enterica]|nr:hypothetical protein [Salmonella enterica]